jgi:hypothetical protein
MADKVKVTDAQAAEAAKSHEDLTRAHLESQPKIRVFVPMVKGEYPLFEFNVNGVHYNVKRGEETDVPKDIADMLYARLRSEGSLTDISTKQMAKMEEAGL